MLSILRSTSIYWCLVLETGGANKNICMSYFCLVMQMTAEAHQ